LLWLDLTWLDWFNPAFLWLFLTLTWPSSI
jgi:hypothetical protein